MMKTVLKRMDACIQIIFTPTLSPYLFRFWDVKDRYCFLKLAEQVYCFELKFVGISTNKRWQRKLWLHYHSNKSSDDVSHDHDSTTTTASNGKKFKRSEELLEEMKEETTQWRVCLWDCLHPGNEERTGNRNPKICLQSVFMHAQLYCWPEYYDNPYWKPNVSW